jgi:hypothetical protein
LTLNFEFGSSLECQLESESFKIFWIDPSFVDDGINSKKVERSNFLSENQLKIPFNLSIEEKGISIGNKAMMLYGSESNLVLIFSDVLCLSDLIEFCIGVWLGNWKACWVFGKSFVLFIISFICRFNSSFCC